MIENQIKKLKKEYLEIEPRENVSEGLSDLWERIDKKPSFPISRYIIFALIALFITSGLFGAVQAAKSGSPLYTVKIAAEKVVNKVVEVLEQKPNVTGEKLEKIEKIPLEDTVKPEIKDDMNEDENSDESKNTENKGSSNESENEREEKSEEHIDQNESNKEVKGEDSNKGKSEEYRQDGNEENGEKEG